MLKEIFFKITKSLRHRLTVKILENQRELANAVLDKMTELKIKVASRDDIDAVVKNQQELENALAKKADSLKKMVSDKAVTLEAKSDSLKKMVSDKAVTLEAKSDSLKKMVSDKAMTLEAKSDSLAESALHKHNETVDLLTKNHAELIANIKAVADKAIADKDDIAWLKAELSDIRKAVQPQYKKEESNKESEIYRQMLSRLLFNQSFGGTIADYCEELDWKNITVYVDEKYWNLVEPVYLSFRKDWKMWRVKQWVTDNPFSFKANEPFSYGNFVAEALTDQKFSDEDIVIILRPIQDIRLVDIFINYGVSKEKIFELPVLLNNIFQYFIFERPLLDIKNKHSEVQIVYVKLTQDFPYKSELTENEKNIIANNISHSHYVKLRLLEKKERLSIAWDEFGYSDEDVIEVLSAPQQYLNKGVLCFEDSKGRLVNTINRNRLTVGVPSDAKRKIYIIGECEIFGFGNEDSKTIESYLQYSLNDLAAQESFEVVNVGRFVGDRQDDFINIINNLSVNNNDIIFLVYRWNKISDPIILKEKTLDLSDIFKKPYPYGDVWIDTGHFGAHGNHMVADALFKFLEEHKFFKTEEKPHEMSKQVRHEDGSMQHGTGSIEHAVELAEYKAMLENTRNAVNCKIGSIVMNCNPFTLGHRYLVEYAAARVKHLYVFAVEEDKSEFPFADRIELIKAGTADLPNVTVLPSGKFIISSLTFTDYFNKAEMQDRVIDPSEDVEIFAKEIAPVLDIRVRFAGEEPLDNITRQYNDTMRQILPRYGIEFVEVPRCEVDGSVISASRVRTLLKTEDFVSIAKLVPVTTLQYLKNLATIQKL